jgi:hypothetical protein
LNPDVIYVDGLAPIMPLLVAQFEEQIYTTILRSCKDLDFTMSTRNRRIPRRREATAGLAVVAPP